MKLTGAGARRFLERPDASIRATLLFGPNRALIGEASATLQKVMLRGDADPYAVTRLTDDDLKRDRAALADALAAQSLLGDARLVRVRLDTESAVEPVIAALASIEAGASLNFLLVEAPAVSSTSAITKAFEKAAAAVCIAYYEESSADLDSFAADEVRGRGVTIDKEALAELRAILPDDRAVLRQEIDKLALYAHDLGRPVSREDVQELLGDPAATQLDRATADALDGRGAAAVEALERLEDASPISALKALERRLLRLTEVRVQIDRGSGADAAVKGLRPPVFWKDQERMAGQAQAWKSDQLAKALDRVWRCEIACKSAGAPQHLLVAHCYRSVAALRSERR